MRGSNLRQVLTGRRYQSIAYIYDLIAFLLIGLHGWSLVFKLPWTLRTLFEAFRPGGFGIPDSDFWAFTRLDASFRPWYNKIARDYRTQGRFGYVWDDGLGMLLGARIYNNWATYRLLYWLGSRRLMAIGYLLIVLLSGGVCVWRFGLWIGLLIGLLVAGSPLIVASYTHRGKPEIFWWALTLLFTFVAFSKAGLLAGLLWSLLAWVNLPASVILAFMLGPALFFQSLSSSSLLGMAIGVIPGVVKHTLRGFYIWRSGFLTRLVSEQTHIYKWLWYPTARELAWWIPFTLSIAATIYTSQHFIVGALILIVGIGLYWVNFRLIYLNDPQSFHLAFWVIGFGYAVAMQSLLGILAILLMAYTRPSACGISLQGDQRRLVNPWRRRLENAWNEIKAFPALTPIALPRPRPLVAFLDKLPDGTRFLAESDGDPRTGSQFRSFWQWTEELLPYRQVDLVNEMYTRLVESELADQYLLRFNAEQMTAQEMKELCQILGVSHVVAYTSATVSSLQTVGYTILAQFDLDTLEQFRQAVHTPAITLTLLQGPSPVTVIEPVVTWKRKGNVLTWQAKAGQLYIVRYRYNPDFRAYQNGKMLKVEPLNPLPGLSLTFMQVKAIANSSISLQFHPRWI